MSGTKEIKRRIKSIKSTKKITKAMELVSASKMRKMVSRTLASRPYATLAWQILQSLEFVEQAEQIPLMTKREVKRALVIMISGNRGLCGVYNAQIAKKMIEYVRRMQKLSPNVPIDIVTIGKKATIAARRIGNVIASFDGLPDDVQFNDTLPISKIILDSFVSGTHDSIVVAYTNFKSVLSQTPQLKQVLPVTNADLEAVLEEAGNEDIQKIPVIPVANVDLSNKRGEHESQYLIEPNPHELIDQMLHKMIRYEVLQMILESRASEESSRMMAMKNANEAAGEMIDGLTLMFNKARQAGITQEISEISAGTAAQE